MKILTIALGACAVLGLGHAEASAQATRPSPPQQEPASGSSTQQGTGSHPTGSAPSLDRDRSVPSTHEKPENKAYGRQTDATGQSLEQGTQAPTQKGAP